MFLQSPEDGLKCGNLSVLLVRFTLEEVSRFKIDGNSLSDLGQLGIVELRVNDQHVANSRVWSPKRIDTCKEEC